MSQITYKFTNSSLEIGHRKQIQINSSVQITELSIFEIRASCLETGMVTISQINNNLYSMPLIIVFKIQKNWSTRTYIITRKS
jgi:hypothetical protein